MSKVIFSESTDPATPESGKVVIFVRTDGLAYSKDDAGVVTLMSAGPVPLNATADFFNAVAIDSPSITVTSDGAIITLSLEKSGTGDIDFIFSDGVYTLDCTPADTVALTGGSDTSPQINYVYVLQSDKTLTASTAGFPSAEHAPIATVLCQSASSLQTDGAYKVHAWTDHIAGTDNQGHLAHLNAWIRNQPATWVSGASCTPAGSLNNFDIATASGVVFQLHKHAYPAFDTAGGSDIYVVNNFATPYNKVTDLSAETNDSGGVALQAWYSVTIWGAVNEASADCKLFCNLPSGSYNNDVGGKATNDDDNFSNYTIPDDFKGVGFLIASVLVSVAGTTYTIQQTTDLRGKFPSSSPGGGATGGNEFIDNVFRIQDDGDVTKEIAFQASGITTGNVRTITMPDADVTLGDADLVNDLSPQLGGDLDVNGNEIVSVSNGDITLAPNGTGVVEQRNSTTTQTHLYYGSYTDASNYERLAISGDGTIATEAAGTGTQQTIKMGTGAQQTVFPQNNDATTPTLAFGTGNTGFYESTNNVLVFASSGAARFQFSTVFKSNTSGRFQITNSAPSATAPNFNPSNADGDTGIGRAGADMLSCISGGVEAIRCTEAAGAIVNDLTGVATLITGHTVAGLPTPALGMIARVTDASGPAIGSTVSGGGAAAAMVWYNGANWTVTGI